MEKLEAKKRIEEIEQIYNEMQGDYTSYSALIKGVEGSGKSTFLTTGRLPILVDLFDPKGAVLFNTDPRLIRLRKERKLFVRFFIKENSQQPTEYLRWEKQWQKDCKSGFLSMFGTYGVDSGTTWLEAMANYITHAKGGKRDYLIQGIRKTGNLQIEDYIPMYNMVMDLIKLSSSQGCDFIYIAHLVRKTIGDGEFSQVVTELDTYERLKSKIPKLFAEKYCMVKKPSSQGSKRILLLDSTGEYEASSQLMASGKLKKEEEPNLKELLKKAGLPTEDKPLVWNND